MKDKIYQYKKTPNHPTLWKLASLLADVALKHAVKCLNMQKLDEAMKYLRAVDRNTEAFPGSDWSTNPEWLLIRRNMHKNMALYHQKKALWQNAYDNLKMAIRLETTLDVGLELAGSNLTCSILLQKMKNYPHSIDHAQNCIRILEKELNIKKGDAILESVYKGRDEELKRKNDKVMT